MALFSIEWLSAAKCIIPVAKKRKLAEALGMSTRLLSHKGFPLSVVSAEASSTIFWSIKSAMRFKMINLCSAGVTDQGGKAFCADWTANAISFSLLSGIWQIISPVAGFMLSRKFSPSGSIHVPPIKFCRRYGIDESEGEGRRRRRKNTMWRKRC